MMKQKKLVKELYKACFEHDAQKELQLNMKEFKKIFKHQEEGKKFNTKWTVIR